MIRPKKSLIVSYLLVVLVVVVFVPWTSTFSDPRLGQFNTPLGYHLVFSYVGPLAVIDYGMVLLELLAVTCIAGFIWLIQDTKSKVDPKTAQLIEGAEMLVVGFALFVLGVSMEIPHSRAQALGFGGVICVYWGGRTLYPLIKSAFTRK